MGAPLPSPCNNVCRMNPANGQCEGCQRTLAEIAAWGTMDDAQRRSVWLQLKQRRAQLRQADAATGRP